MTDSHAPATMNIASRLTAAIPAGIATIAVRGPEAESITMSLVQLRVQNLKVGRIHYGTWHVPLSGNETTQASDESRPVEQLVVCRTAEQQVELHCHGGNAISTALLQSLESQGCQIVPAAQWPSDFECSIARQAEQALLRASTDRAAIILLDQLGGSLRTELVAIVALLVEHERDVALERLNQLLHWSPLGMRLSEPWRVVLAGPPNVGKSSLMNAIIGQSRAIVHAEAGTTRDWLESITALDGWPIALTDTAGVRDAAGAIEAEGVRRAQARAAEADLLVLVVDAQSGWTDTHENLAQLPVQRRLIAWNKTDLVDSEPSFESSMPVVKCSGVTPGGADALMRSMVNMLVPENPAPGSALPFHRDHVSHLSSARESVLVGDFVRAVAEVQSILR